MLYRWLGLAPDQGSNPTGFGLGSVDVGGIEGSRYLKGMCKAGEMMWSAPTSSSFLSAKSILEALDRGPAAAP